MKTDNELKRDVEAELKFEPSVVEAHIGVGVKDGVVTLSGHVPSYPEKWGAEKAAKRVAGVKAVADELHVKLPGVSKRTDEDVAAACVTALQNYSSVPRDAVKVVVSDGWVSLDGQVEWQFQKDAARKAVRYLPGVLGVSNNVAVKPHVSPTDVKAKIEAAFKRSAEFDAHRVSVEADGGKVILRGRVRTFAEQDMATRTAWAAPGVTTVENHLTIGV